MKIQDSVGPYESQSVYYDVITNPRWRTAAHIKNVMSANLSEK